MQIIAVLNQKGGCGKTSTCLHTAGALAEMGSKVVLVDLDPQMSLTMALHGSFGAEHDAGLTVLAAFEDEGLSVDEFDLSTDVAGIRLIAGSPSLAAFNAPIGQTGLERTMADRLGEFLATVDPSTDYVLIDCPPHLGALAFAAVAASDGVVVPLVPDAMGVAAVIPVQGFLNRAGLGHDLPCRHLGYVLSRVKPRSPVHRVYGGQLRDALGEAVFTTEIPESAAYGHSVEARLPITHGAGKGTPAAQATRELAVELVLRSKGVTHA